MKKVVIPSLHLFLFLITFIVNSCTKLASDFDANSSAEEIINKNTIFFEINQHFTIKIRLQLYSFD